MSHLSEAQLNNLKNGKLPIDERIVLLEHIKDCPYCSNEFSMACSNKTFSIPKNLKENLIDRSKKYKVQRKKKREFGWYCFRVGISCLGLIGILIISELPIKLPKLIDKEPSTVPGIIRSNYKADKIKDFFTIKENHTDEKKK